MTGRLTIVGLGPGPAEWVTPHFTYRPLLDDPGDEMVLEAAS